MRTITLIGTLLIVLGSLALVFQGITYMKQEEVVDIGPLELEAEHEERIPIPPVVGIIAFVSGVGMVIYGARNK